MKQLFSLLALMTFSFTLTAQNPDAVANSATLAIPLNAPANNQASLAWYKGALLFSSDRAKPTGSPKSAPITSLFYAEGIYDFEQGNVSRWNPIQLLKGVKTAAADRAFAYDKNTNTYYVMRCPNPAKGQQRSCNIFAYTVDPKGKMSKPMQQSFHDNGAVVGFPALSSDGSIMFFSVQKDGKTNLFVVKKTGANAWSTPMMLPAVINTENGVESYPQLFRDSLLFFASNGHPGMGGMDIFYTKIMVNGAGHAVSRNSDLSGLEFSEPVNLGTPINSSADDISMLVQQNGSGGFFISNRPANGTNKFNIYNFNQAPHTLVNELGTHQTSIPCPPTTPIVTEVLAVHKIDTVFIETKIEIPVEKIVEREVFVGSGDEHVILQQKDAQIARLEQDLIAMQIAHATQIGQVTSSVTDVNDIELSQLQRDLTNTRNQLIDCQIRLTQQHATTPTSPVYNVAAPTQTSAPIPVTASGIVYRVQVAASTNTPAPGEFRETFDALHRAMPDLRMETVFGEDGFHRYVTVPFATFAEADAMRRRIQALGYQCFVSGYRGNNRVSMSVR
jgi:hypothetical protein